MLRSFLLVVLLQVALWGLARSAAAEGLVDKFKGKITAAEREVLEAKERLAKTLLPREAALWKELDKAAGPSKEFSAVVQAAKASAAALRAIDSAALHTRAEFNAFDQAAAQHAAAQIALKRADSLRRAEVRGAAAKTSAGKKLLEELAGLEQEIRAAERDLETANVNLLAATVRLRNYTSPPPPPGRVVGDGSMLRISPPADAADRARRFAARNSPENLQALAEKFFSRIDLATPGLEKISDLLKAGKHAAALEVWRDYFFAKLRDPAKHGLPATWGGDLDTASLLRLPEEAKLAEAMNGVFSTPRAKADVGSPGTINWGDPGPDRHADPNRNAYLDFYTMRGQEGFVDIVGPHLILLKGYAASGDRKYLHRWAEVIDDWAMNAPGDMENSPFNIRQYPVLCSFRPVALASTLTDVLEAQPDFATAMPAPTLARMMLTVMEEYPPAFVRLARRGIYNWRCIAMTGSVLTAQVFPEFHTARWQLMEAKRLMELNWSHKILRDGGNLEQGNWGHEPNDQVHLGRAYRLLKNQPPSWLDEAWRAEWEDNVRVNARYYLHMLKPDGYSYRFSRVATGKSFLMRGAFDDPAMPIQTNLLLGEAEAANRLQWVFGEYATERPKVNSESLAYLGASIFRSDWEPNASFLYFQCSHNRDCNGREDANGFALHAFGHAQVLAPPLVVDDRIQNVHHGLTPEPGGKTIWLTYDDRAQPNEGRFHASPHFDFTEGTYQGVYDFQSGDEALIFGDYGYKALGQKLKEAGQQPIDDVQHARQVLSVRGEDLVIVTDRFRSEAERRFSQNYTLFTPVQREGWRRRLELAKEEQREALSIDAEKRTLRTENPGLPSVSIRHFGPVSPTYRIIEDNVHRLGDAKSVDEALTNLGSAKLKKWAMGLPLPVSKKVRAEWKSRGEQTLVTAITTRPASFGEAPFAGDLRDIVAHENDTAIGFTAVTRRGTSIIYRAAKAKQAKLIAGKIEVAGEAVLVAEQKGKLHGMVLGARRFAHAGETLEATRDFEFVIDSGKLHLTPIYRPIAPVVIEPEATAFTETQSIALSSATPEVEIRYTLDGSEPTSASPKYEGPIEISQTTRIKAKAFRLGLKETPWTADGTHATVTSWTTFEKMSPRKSTLVADAKPGLRWEYLEGRWAELFAHGEELPAQKQGTSPQLIDVSMRGTDGAFAVRSTGFIEVPVDGVYTFYAPHEWQFPDGENGYELRVSIDGELWQPATRRHAHGAWSIPLAKGRHALRVVFIDFRPRTLKYELWGNFPNPQVVWKGNVPKLEIAGPNLSKREIPQDWLWHRPGDE